MSNQRFLAALMLSVVASGCADDPRSPSETAVATIGVAGETFRVQLVGERQLAAARAAQGGGPARIPNGRIVPGAGVNAGWSWHLEDLEFRDRVVRRPALGRRATGHAIRRRALLSMERTGVGDPRLM